MLFLTQIHDQNLAIFTEHFKWDKGGKIFYEALHNTPSPSKKNNKKIVALYVPLQYAECTTQTIFFFFFLLLFFLEAK